MNNLFRLRWCNKLTVLGTFKETYSPSWRHGNYSSKVTIADIVRNRRVTMSLSTSFSLNETASKRGGRGLHWLGHPQSFTVQWRR